VSLVEVYAVAYGECHLQRARLAIWPFCVGSVQLPSAKPPARLAIWPFAVEVSSR
jgi:hypothetical protein